MAYISVSQHHQQQIHDEYEYDDMDDFYDDNHINNTNSNSFEGADDSEGNFQ